MHNECCIRAVLAVSSARSRFVVVVSVVSMIASILTGAHDRTGTTLHVPGDYPTIQAAIDASVDGDTVLIADGTYTGEGNRDLDFGGRAITVRSAGGPEHCVISTDLGQPKPSVYELRAVRKHDGRLIAFFNADINEGIRYLIAVTVHLVVSTLLAFVTEEYFILVLESTLPN